MLLAHGQFVLGVELLPQVRGEAVGHERGDVGAAGVADDDEARALPLGGVPADGGFNLAGGFVLAIALLAGTLWVVRQSLEASVVDATQSANASMTQAFINENWPRVRDLLPEGGLLPRTVAAQVVDQRVIEKQQQAQREQEQAKPVGFGSNTRKRSSQKSRRSTSPGGKASSSAAPSVPASKAMRLKSSLRPMCCSSSPPPRLPLPDSGMR